MHPIWVVAAVQELNRLGAPNEKTFTVVVEVGDHWVLRGRHCNRPQFWKVYVEIRCLKGCVCHMRVADDRQDLEILEIFVVGQHHSVRIFAILEVGKT